MFSTLIESRAVRSRRTGGSLASILLHGGVVVALVVATRGAGVMSEPDSVEAPVQYTALEPPPPPVTPEAASAQVFTSAPMPKGFQVLTAPVEIPVSLPPIDFGAPATNANDFTGVGRPGGLATGVSTSGSSTASSGGVFSAWEVEKPVIPTPGSPGPSYPEMLRDAGVEGNVLAQFVVDTTGRVQAGSFVALSSEHALFTAAVRAALPKLRFLPAEAGGRRVPQLVQQAFQFTVKR